MKEYRNVLLKLQEKKILKFKDIIKKLSMNTLNYKVLLESMIYKEMNKIEELYNTNKIKSISDLMKILKEEGK